MQRDELVRVFNKRLNNEIGVSQQMGIQVAHFDGESVSLHAPLAINRNDKQTAFAGSLYSTCVLSGWSLLQLVLELRGFIASVVVFDSSVRYLKPVTGDILAISQPLGSSVVEHFVTQFCEFGKARIDIVVEIFQEGRPAVEFAGKYAAMLIDAPKCLTSGLEETMVLSTGGIER